MQLAIAVSVLSGFSALAGEPDGPDLKSLYDAHKWSELRDAIRHKKAPALYRGAVGYAFNNFRQAEINFRSAIRSAPHSGQAYEAYEGLSHLYSEYGQYRRLISVMEERWAAFPHKSEEQNERTTMAPFRGLPDQITGKPRTSTLHHDGNTFIPVSIDGKPAKYFFDTGASDELHERVGSEAAWSCGTRRQWNYGNGDRRGSRVPSRGGQ